MPRAVTPEADLVKKDTTYYFFGFEGGMRQDIESSKMADNEYLLSVNLRNRFGVLSTIKNPKQLTLGLPIGGNTQGIFGAGFFVVVVISGKLYYRNFLNDTGYFNYLPGFSLDPNVPTVWAELVPASTINFLRTNDSSTNASGKIVFGNVAGLPSPQCLLVTDGINQPLGILPTGQVFKTQTFDEWSLDGKREYVPIGISPKYISGILYMFSPDKKEVYRSVTGRPLDFVIAVDEPGNKLQDGLFQVEASRMSIKHFFEDMTCIFKISLPQEGFFLSTINACTIVNVDRTNPLFGEPTFTYQDLFPTGPNNQFSIVDNVGDTAFIDNGGVRSFNSIQQFRIEGKNAPFTKKLSRLFDGIVQNVTCATEFDNFSIFSMDSVYGAVLCLYDTLTQSWAGLDIYPGVGKIKQFADIKYPGVRRLFFIDDRGNVYEAFAGDTTAPWTMFTKEWSTGEPEIAQRIDRMRLVYQNATEVGDISITDFMDRAQGQTNSKPITADKIVESTAMQIPLSLPFGDASIDAVNNLTYKFLESQQGWKAGAFIQGNSECEIIGLEIVANLEEKPTSTEEAASVYATA